MKHIHVNVGPFARHFFCFVSAHAHVHTLRRTNLISVGAELDKGKRGSVYIYPILLATRALKCGVTGVGYERHVTVAGTEEPTAYSSLNVYVPLISFDYVVTAL